MKKLISITILSLVFFAGLPPQKLWRVFENPCVALTYAAEKGLVAYWSFDEGSGKTSADLSGNKHDAAINGATWSKEGIGYCLSFDGTTSIVDVKNAKDLGLTKAGTVMFWMRASGSNSSWQNVIRKWSGESRNYGIYLNVDNGVLSWSASYIESSLAFNDLSSGFNPWDDSWHHIAVTFDGAGPNVVFYIDGVEVSSSDPGFAEMKTNNEALAIGDHFPGMIDEVKIYNRPLSAEEIDKYYSETSKKLGEAPKEKKKESQAKKAVKGKKEPGPKGLVGYYGFEPADPEEWVPGAAAGITTDKKEIISGKSSMKGNSMEGTSDWNEFFHTDAAKLPLEGGGTYTVYFKYKILEKGDGARSYFLARSIIGGAPGPADKGWTDINEEAGEEGVKLITFALDEFPDYYLIIGIFKQSSIVIDDFAVFEGEPDEGTIEKVIRDESKNREKEQKAPVKKEEVKAPAKPKEEPMKVIANYGFEANEKDSDWDIREWGTFSSDKNEIISGKASLKGDGRNDSDDWHEFFHTSPDALLLQGGKEYTISFNYKVLAKSEDAYFYFLARSNTAGVGPSDRGWTQWTDGPGSIGSKTITITLDDFEDYNLIVGIFRGGAITIDDFKVSTGSGPAEAAQKAKAAASKTPLESLIFIARTNNRYNIFKPGEEINLDVSFMTSDDILNFQDLNAFQEEHMANGDSWGKYEKDPDGSGQVVKVTYLVKEPAQDWVDWMWNPTTPVDWSNFGKLEFEIYPLQNADYLTAKFVDQKKILLERSVGSLKPNQWQSISLPLKGDRSNMVQINFYVPCYAVPVDKEVSFYMKNMRLTEPVEAAAGKDALKGRKMALNTDILDFFGRKVKEDSKQFVFGEGKAGSNFKLKMDNPGFYWINLSLKIDNQEIKKRMGMAVIAPNKGAALDYNSPFGVNFMSDYTLGNLAGIKWDRRGMGWKWAEQQPGKFVWDGYDAMTVESYKNGINIMPVLSTPPDWERKMPKGYKPISTGVHAGWGDFPPKDLDKWGKYVFETVSRYKGKIKAWEIWNEPWPNCLFFNGGSVQDYTDLLKVAYEQAHKADPACIVIGLGGTEYNHMTQVFKAGGFPYMDVASIHHYQPGPNPPESAGYIDAIRKAREVMRKFGDGKEKDLWMTEMGWPTNITAPEFADNWVGISEELQGKYLPRTYILGLAEGLKKHFWFMFSNGGSDPKNFEHNQGLLFNDFTPKPSFAAYCNLTRELESLDYKGKLDLGGSIYCYLFEKSSRSCFVLWSLSEGAEMVISALPDSVKIVDIMGGPVKPETKDGKTRIPLSDAVMYLSSDKGNSAEIKAILEKAKIAGVSPVKINAQKTKRLDANRMLVSIEAANNLNREIKGELKISLPKGYEATPPNLGFGPLRPANPATLGFIVENISAPEASANIHFVIDAGEAGVMKGSQVIDLPIIKIAKTPMKIDASLDEWKDFQKIALNMPAQCSNPDKDPKDFSSVCYVTWDKDNLYFAADVTDDFVSCNDAATADFQHCDYYRLYLDLGKNASGSTFDGDDFEFVFTPTGPGNKPMLKEVSQAFGGPGHPGLDLSKIKIASKIVAAGLALPNANGWVIEAAIPWAQLSFKPKAGQVIGIKFITGDTDEKGEREDEYVYGDMTGAYWQDPTRFLDIYFAP
ncbi:hypothetical protein AUJ67_08285 [Candidatus Desantisbacteria bacterium CG1_02_49_89]|nr:MAG: hypothetical protein AUJ67_08285 [Candidatus Desantisbacteria bacterium CG1_02_49_89]